MNGSLRDALIYHGGICGCGGGAPDPALGMTKSQGQYVNFQMGEGRTSIPEDLQ